jgi:hypothetical protein
VDGAIAPPPEATLTFAGKVLCIGGPDDTAALASLRMRDLRHRRLESRVKYR